MFSIAAGFAYQTSGYTFFKILLYMKDYQKRVFSHELKKHESR